MEKGQSRVVLGQSVPGVRMLRDVEREEVGKTKDTGEEKRPDGGEELRGESAHSSGKVGRMRSGGGGELRGTEREGETGKEKMDRCWANIG